MKRYDLAFAHQPLFHTIVMEEEWSQMYIGEVGKKNEVRCIYMAACAYDGTSFPLTSEHSRYLLHNRMEQKKKRRVQKRWLKTKRKSGSRKTESSKRAYHELQRSDITFDAHSAFIAPTHRKRLRAVHMCNCTMIFMPVRKDTKKWGGLPSRKFAIPLK